MYDPLDERGIPTSKGVPVIVRIATVLGLLAIFAIGADTLAFAPYGHAWPATKTLRIPLNGSYVP